ncbi:hypothetical protein M9979_07720 [Sphingomonas sp. RP10(2022)]|uniref:Uncharacterized protein n=1 Tax=Sphingomonas liriopis TaxID=2949094 RepID=A0A9X2KQ92_9SPHN|nr:hypothetical protein [Sphingomonas liriopis]MCP3734755.1 hypothetical protein [Sphingomonas liriopis]
MLITAIAAAILSNTTPVPATTAPQPTAPAAYDPRVCFEQRITGSMLPIRTCKKLSDWRARGVDPLAKK